jgi:quaternary ammonium compound-resistance protein SugE
MEKIYLSATTLAWLYLILAGLLEALWAMGLKFSEGFTKPFATVITLVFVVCSFFLLSKAMEVLPVSIAYASWCAIGISALVIIEYYLLGTQLTLANLFSILLIIVGIIGLQFAK